MLKAILFDFDGTIADSLPKIHDSWDRSFQLSGKKLTHDELVKMYYVEKEVKEATHGVDGDQLHSYYRELIDAVIDKVELEEHVFEVLEALRERGLKTAIISFGHAGRIKNYLKKRSMNNLFDAVLGRENVDKQKPDPTIAFLAMKQLGATPEESLMVGDTIMDIQTGENAGMLTAFYYPEHNRLYTDMELFREVKPDFEFHHYDEFFDKIERLISSS